MLIDRKDNEISSQFLMFNILQMKAMDSSSLHPSLKLRFLPSNCLYKSDLCELNRQILTSPLFHRSEVILYLKTCTLHLRTAML